MDLCTKNKKKFRLSFGGDCQFVVAKEQQNTQKYIITGQ